MKRKLLPHLFIGTGIFLAIGFLYLVFQPKTQVNCANSISCKESLELKVENNAIGVFNGKTVTPPKVNLAQKEPDTNVLGDEASSSDKHIYIDLETQTLSAYQGQTLFMKTLISSGKWGRTPTGDFSIWEKLRATRMTGGSGNDFYDLPNVPYVMFFSGKNASQGAGFSLHGTYWHNNFGHPMSHGCVNMRTADAQKLYNWVNPTTNGSVTVASNNNPGTAITIYGQTPL